MKMLTTLLLATLLSIFTVTGFAQSNVKWEETFDTEQDPPGWRIINNDGSAIHTDTGFDAWFWTANINSGEILPQAGKIFWISTFKHANAQGLIDEWLISPKIQGIEQGDSLHFYAGANDNNFKDSLRVFISTTDSLLASFTNQIGYFKVDGPKGTYHKYSFDLSAFAGSDVFFGVNFYIVNGQASGNQPYVDHFIVTTNMATSVDEAPAAISGFRLQQNYPNPFNPSTSIPYSIEHIGQVELHIYDLLGRKIRTLLRGSQSAGEHSAVWDGKDDFGKQVASGHYLYQLKAGELLSTRRMILLK